MLRWTHPPSQRAASPAAPQHTTRLRSHAVLASPSHLKDLRLWLRTPLQRKRDAASHPQQLPKIFRETPGGEFLFQAARAAPSPTALQGKGGPLTPQGFPGSAGPRVLQRPQPSRAPCSASPTRAPHSSSERGSAGPGGGPGGKPRQSSLIEL